jgi:hypothetical protein
MMKSLSRIAIVLLAVAGAAHAADPKKNLFDHSSQNLIDGETAKRIMDENIPAKVWTLYPANKWVFVSQVEGGVTEGGQCVVTARTMLLPLTPAMKAVLFRPQKTATTFGSAAGGGTEQCKALARDKLKESTIAIVSALVKT